MIIERIRFGNSSIYRPSAISKLIRDERNVLLEEAISFDGEKRKANDKEHESSLGNDTHEGLEQPANTPAADVKGADTAPLDIVA